ncbi:hypothetical protein OE88DRAFT_1740194 [Heliocybe sulcata]|uniref:Uncharacterized protein n=1 Tax=Heliocybe sulcata TaxID=5364 RepID=A0A5C3MJC2_9AGAM|nr:hypothetical protein OE88DRAFT_1740194 [Heliocybe sulcata]
MENYLTDRDEWRGALQYERGWRRNLQMETGEADGDTWSRDLFMEISAPSAAVGRCVPRFGGSLSPLLCTEPTVSIYAHMAPWRSDLQAEISLFPDAALMPTGAATSHRCFLVFRALIGTASTGARTTDAPFHTLVLPQRPGGCTGTVALAPSVMTLCLGSAQAGSP